MFIELFNVLFTVAFVVVAAVIVVTAIKGLGQGKLSFQGTRFLGFERT